MTTREYERGCAPSCVEDSSICIDIKNCCNKLNVIDWLSDINDPISQNKYVEIRFKNTRKGIFENSSNINLYVGDIVAVEAMSGHDIGIVSAIGYMAILQMRKYKSGKAGEIKKIYRKAKPNDISKWKEAIELEMPTMLRTREIASSLNLNMKIGDVEYQGDKTKAIFYYISEERVDFRGLIKRMAEEFKIRIEMKQIGARQEAGRIGGIGPCGRELCCTTWVYDFNSVSTNSARYQELSLNPQKLAGQCSKLKCCLNYELSVYLDARKHFPENVSKIITAQGDAYHVKNDIFKQQMYFEIKINDIPVIKSLHVDKVKEILKLNEKGIKPDNIFENEKNGGRSVMFKDELNNDSINRFDSSSENAAKKNRKRKKRRNRKYNNPKND